MEKVLNLVDGKLVESKSKSYLENPEPATAQTYSLVSQGDPEDVDQAVAAARRAFPSWSKKTMEERAQLLRQLAQKVRVRSEEFSQMETKDTGKPIKLSRSLDIPRVSRNLEFFADCGTSLSSESFSSPQMMNYVVREPLGPVAVISPWNLPLYLLSWKIAPALMTGNTVVAKPSEVTPMTAFYFSKLAAEVLPPGVFNILHGTGAKIGDALTGHEDIRAVSFTGSTSTGQRIYERASRSFKKVSLEMGGKNPTVVFKDADLEKAASETVRAAFQNQGQICLCGSRILIEKSIYSEFVKMLVEKTQALNLGDPTLESTDQGSVVSKAHFEKVLNHLEIAKKEAGTFLLGGNPAKVMGRCEKGWFVEPTLIEGLSDRNCQTLQTEIFGPVASLQSFASEEEAIDLANSTKYGLSASVWTANVGRAQRLSRDIKAGVVWVNSWMLRDLRIPFGGMKSSGLGREGGEDSMKFFTESKTVCVPYE